MDVKKILEELRLEREQLEEAIATLERISLERNDSEHTGVSAKRRGRPPGRKSGSKKEPDKPDESGHT